MSLGVRIRLLGPVGATAGSEEIALGGTRPRAVLAVLSLAFPRACSTDQIVDALWGEDPPASARNAVQVNVTGLRKALKPHEVTIERIGDGYALRGPLLVDAAQFEELVSAGRTLLRAGAVEDSMRSLVEALDLWQGTPLSDLGNAAFVDASREILEVARQAALVDLSEAQIRAGDLAAATSTAQTLLQHHPYDERGWIILATAHYWSGQQDQALATCRRARDVLREELGIDPTPALVEIESQILNHDLPPRSSTSSETHEAASALPPLPPLPPHVVGREELADEVTSLLGSGQRLVSLVGIGGIGKTTLALEVANRVDGTVFCALETEQEAAAALGRVCRVLGADADADPATAIGAAMPRGVLVLDNVEQVAGIGLALDHVLSRVPELQVLVSTRRPTGARLERAVLVPPLGPEPAEEVFRTNAERVRPGITSSLEAGVVRRLCELLDGIPLALELAATRVRTLTPRQLLDRIETSRASVLDGVRAAAVPERQLSLQGVLEEAYQALPEHSRRLFALLGSVDGSISLELLEAASDGWVDDPVDALEELVACGLVALDLEGRVSMRVPVREFATTKGERAHLDDLLHQAVLSLVEDSAPRLSGPDTVATMARLARDDDALTSALVRATESGSAAAAAALAFGLNRYWLLSGRVFEGRTWIERGRAMDGHAPADGVRMAVLAGTFASYLDHEDSAALLTDALTRAQALDLPVDRLIVNGWCCLAAYAAHREDFATADEAVRRASELAAGTGDSALVALARDVDGHVASYMKDPERALGAKLSGLAEARADGDPYVVVSVLTDICDDLLTLGRIDEALAYADEAYDLTRAFDPGPLLSALLLIRGITLTAADRVPAARGNLVAALTLLRDGRPDPLSTADALYALASCAIHEIADAEACRLYGAADALYSQQGVSPRNRLFPVLLDARDALVERLGAARFETLAALGSSDPARTLDRLLGEDGDRDPRTTHPSRGVTAQT